MIKVLQVSVDKELHSYLPEKTGPISTQDCPLISHQTIWTLTRKRTLTTKIFKFSKINRGLSLLSCLKEANFQTRWATNLTWPLIKEPRTQILAIWIINDPPPHPSSDRKIHKTQRASPMDWPNTDMFNFWIRSKTIMKHLKWLLWSHNWVIPWCSFPCLTQEQVAPFRSPGWKGLKKTQIWYCRCWEVSIVGLKVRKTCWNG